MGQYYKAVVLSKNTIKVMDSWSHDNGSKLMEHSYYGNNFVNSVLNVCRGQKDFKLGWVGDYSDGDAILKDLPEDKRPIHTIAYQSAWQIEARSDESYIENNDRIFGCPAKTQIGKNVYICNRDREEAVLHRCRPLKSGIHISPLPILCAVGNGLGGGDYRGSCMDMVGSWAYDNLFITTEEPGFEIIDPDIFVEGY